VAGAGEVAEAVGTLLTGASRCTLHRMP